MKNIFNLFNKNKKDTLSNIVLENNDKKKTTDLSVIKQYKNEINEIKIENQPFRLSGLLHILTNKSAKLLKDNGHTDVLPIFQTSSPKYYAAV